MSKQNSYVHQGGGSLCVFSGTSCASGPIYNDAIFYLEQH
jgi:hypothetical protein